MKKVISVILALAMILSLAGCKKNIPTENKVDNSSKIVAKSKTVDDVKPEKGAKLTLWVKDKTYGDAVKKAFEKKYDVEVTVEEQGLEVVNKVKNAGPAGKGPDVFQCAHDAFPKGLKACLFRQMDDVFTEAIKKNMSEVGVQTCTNDNKVYGVPISMECMCLFYNKDLVGDKPATTLEQIMEEAKTFNDKKKSKFEILWKPGDGYQASALLFAGGWRLYGPNGTDGDKPGFDTDEYVKGLELLQKMHETIPVSATDLGNASFFKSELIAGKCKYYVGGPWDIQELTKKKVNFGVATLPTYEGKDLQSFAGVQNIHVSSYTKYPIASELLAYFMGTEEGAKVLYESKNEIPTIKDVLKIEGLNKNENIQNIIKQFNKSIPMPSQKNIQYFWPVQEAVGKAVFDGKLTPKQGQAKAIKEYNNYIKASK